MEPKTRSAARMVQMFSDDPALVENLKKDPIRVLKDAARKAEAETVPAYVTDKMLYRIAVSVLGGLAITAAISSVVIVMYGKTTPEVLVALGSAAVGALVGLFATPPGGK